MIQYIDGLMPSFAEGQIPTSGDSRLQLRSAPGGDALVKIPLSSPDIGNLEIEYVNSSLAQQSSEPWPGAGGI